MMYNAATYNRGRHVEPNKRPAGIWFLTIIAALFAGIGPLFATTYFLTQGEIVGGLIPLSIVRMVLNLAILPAAFAAWRGRPWAFRAFPVLVGVYFVLVGADSVLSMQTPGLPAAVTAQLRTVAIRSFLWVPLLIWYFRRPQTRAWFDRTV